jgi:phosphosulfolactate phosphohydrolase-like enzyme
MHVTNTLKLTDAAKLAQYIWDKAAPNPESFISQTQHGCYLREIGMEHDIQECLSFDKFPIVPKYNNGKISL